MEQVSKTPDAVAVVFEDEALSYGELNRRANRVGKALPQESWGVKPDGRVGSLCRAQFGDDGWFAGHTEGMGGAYVPLDPDCTLWSGSGSCWRTVQSTLVLLTQGSSARGLIGDLEGQGAGS